MEYVIAALDSSDNVSPLSNPLSTIFAESSAGYLQSKNELTGTLIMIFRSRSYDT